MPKFNKTINELETRFDKWLYIIRNLNKLDRIPEQLKENIFERLFELAEIAKFSNEEVRTYENSLKTYRDLKNSIDTAREEGEIIGKIEGKKEGIVEGMIKGKMERNIEIVKEMLKDGESNQKIIKYTGLNIEQILQIQNDL